MKQHTMPNKNPLPPTLSQKELEEWNKKVREAVNEELDEEVKKLFKLENYINIKRRT